jgi:citrate lyase beta subunit
VRINPLDEGGIADLAGIVRPGLAGIMIPKIDGPGDVVRLGHYLDVLESREGLSAGSVNPDPAGCDGDGARALRHRRLCRDVAAAALRADLGSRGSEHRRSAPARTATRAAASPSPTGWCARSVPDGREGSRRRAG